MFTSTLNLICITPVTYLKPDKYRDFRFLPFSRFLIYAILLLFFTDIRLKVRRLGVTFSSLTHIPFR